MQSRENVKMDAASWRSDIHPVSVHAANLVAVLIHVCGVVAVVGALILQPAEDWNIDHIIRGAVREHWGRLRFLGWCGVLFWDSL